MQSTFVILSVFTALGQAASTTSTSASSTATASYSLQTTYSGSTFFSGFTFFTDADPTHGFVTYVDQATAQSEGLISANDGSPVYIGVDHTNTYNGSASYYNINGVGRPSVRVASNAKFNHGLFIADIANMPGGVCGTWPALWTLGDGTWPYHGEIDIIEQVNTASTDLSSLHTAYTCNAPASSVTQTGTTQATNCTYDVSTGANSGGCGVADSDTTSFGLNFNINGGGVYAMEWTSSYIKVWYFPRSSIPSDITNGAPVPSGWGSPDANFQGDCNIDANFKNHQIVLDTTFCGDWAGNVWSSTCASSTGVSSCSVYVGNNPNAFKNMYWSINSIKVYQQPSVSSSSTISSSSTTSLSSSSVRSTSLTSSSSQSSSSSSVRSTTSTTSSSSGSSSSSSSRSTTSASSSSSHSSTTLSTTTSRSSSSSSSSPVTTQSSKLATSSSSSSVKTTTTTTKRHLAAHRRSHHA